MSTEKETTAAGLARRNGSTPAARTAFPDPMQLGPVFAESGMFKDATDPAKAIVKIIAGQELGLGPMASMTGIHMIEGKPTLSANLLAAQVKRHPVYDYIVRDHQDAGCRIEFFQNGESIGISEFNTGDAEKAGMARKQNWQRYPKAMMFARALSQGVRWYCPDVTAGSPAYVPEELGGEVIEDESTEPAPVAAVPSAEAGLQGEVVAEIAAHHDGIGEDRAAEMVERILAVGIPSRDLALQLVVFGVEHDGIDSKKKVDSKKKATAALAGMTEEQADQLDGWISQCADKLAAKDGGEG